MARRVTWSPEARQDLADIYHYIKLDNLKAAKSVTDRIRRLTKALPDQPWIGRVVPEFGREDIREQIHNQYRIVYQLVGDDQIRVLHIFDTAQEELPGL